MQCIFSQSDSDSGGSSTAEKTKKTKTKGRKKKVVDASSDSSDEEYDILNDAHVRSARKQIRASKNVPNAVRTSKNSSKSTPATTSASTSTSKAPICAKCNAPMKKKNGFYCPNKCKKS